MGEKQNQTAQSRTMSVLTDIQFWVPLAVLVGGLLLLHSLH
jgi:lipopolysaccharide export LptBFGC system permease protein LptF